MREGKLDVRKFNFTSLIQLINLVATYQKDDLHVFFKYINTCFDQNYFSQIALSTHFGNLTQIFTLFVKEGFISEDQLSRTYYTFALTLKDKIEKEGVARAISFNDLISVIWSLAVTEDEQLMNPIIPKLYERLHEFKRQIPLNRDELMQLYQVIIYAEQDMIKTGRWP